MDPTNPNPLTVLQPGPATPVAPMAPTLPPDLSGGVPPIGGPAVAQDKDVIEPEWVDKAERIVAKTRHDPYEQAKALNALKADYIHKRYGKDVKVVDD